MLVHARVSLAVMFALIASIVVLVNESHAAEESQVKVTTVLEGLDNPADVAISPGGEVLVAESGAGRVIRVAGSKAEPVVTDFAVDSREQDGRTVGVGPLSLAFVGDSKLVVGCGGLPNGEDMVRLYALPGPGESLSASDTYDDYGPWPADKNSATGEGDFAALAVVRGKDHKWSDIFVASNGDPSRGWIGRMRSGGHAKITPFVAVREAGGVGLPVAIAVAPTAEQQYLVVALEDAEADGESQLAFYERRSGRLLLRLSAGLHDVSGIAYSTRTPQLFAVSSASKASGGGLYRLDQGFADGKQSVTPVKIVELDRPTSLAFATNGTLFVTTAGAVESDKGEGKGEDEGEEDESEAGDGTKSGKLLMIDSGL